MRRDRQFTRIDIREIKIQIGKKLGTQKAVKYFDLLDRFFAQKLSKSEFNKLCIAIIGRENVALHNLLVTSILKNACLSHSPPPKRPKLESPKSVVDNNKLASNNGYQRSCLQSLCRGSGNRNHPGVRDHRFTDRPSPSPLGPHGKPTRVSCKGDKKALALTLDQDSPPELVSSNGDKKTLALTPTLDRESPNGLVSSNGGKKTLDQESPPELVSSNRGKKTLTLDQESPTELLSLGSRPVEVNSEDDGEEVNQATTTVVTAPLGIPWNCKGNRKVFGSGSLTESHVETCVSVGHLPDSNSLMRRLEQSLEKEGLSVSLDCVNLLNSGLDVFLKGLIKPTLVLARSASLLDFRTAMEVDPTVLGEDWPTQLEKVCLRESENWDTDN